MALVVVGVGQMILGHRRSLAYSAGASISINGGKGQMILGPRRPLAYSGGASFSINGGKKLTSPPSSTATVCFSNLSSKSSLRCSSDDNGSFNHHEGSGLEDFTVLGADVPWETGTMWTIFAFYLFSFHIPLSFGGLSILSNLLHQPVLDPETQAISLLGIQIFELSATLFLLKSTANPEFKLLSIFKAHRSPKQRNPWLASVLGFGSLVFLVFLTSFVADSFLVSQTTNNPELKKILQSSNLSTTACGIAYCAIIPVLEEIIYRGFLLGSISSSMKWQRAVLLSSAIFSAIHFSGENSFQLFIIGCVLGCTYCWTGDLKSSILIHSLYNAMILAITYIY